jgi:IclR family KDG regulon transcriptional repressor
MEDRIKVKSLYKALKILECFTEKTPELGITEISEMLGLYKSNVFNILSTFEEAGYIIKNNENNKYRPGNKILELAYVITSGMDFRKVAMPYLQEISKAANEIVYLGIPDKNEVLYLDMVYPKNTVPTKTILGEKAPLYSTAIGKAIMAHLPEDRITEIVSEGLRKITSNTITDKDKLMEELKITASRGYAVDNMESEYGIKCVGKAIFDRKGQVIAGVSISGPSLRFNDENIKYFADLLDKNVKLIMEKL